MKNEHPEVKFGKTGVLLINLGTPDSTNWWDIRKYLKELEEFYNLALEENKKLSVLINRELAENDDLDDALNIIMNSIAIDSSRKLAEDFAILSKEAIVWLPDSEYIRALLALPEFVLSRIY